MLLGAVGYEHLFHQFGICQQLLNQRRLLPALLGELSQPSGCRGFQDDELYKFRVQLSVRQKRCQVQLGNGLDRCVPRRG